MKKSFVALAVLGAFAGTSMAADVTMYGVVDTGLLYQHGEASASIDGIGSASAEVDSFSMEPGTNSASRFGIRGTEDLGNGMTVGFKLENGFESGTGALKTDSKLFDRESTLFIKGGFGTVYAGRRGGLALRRSRDPRGSGLQAQEPEGQGPARGLRLHREQGHRHVRHVHALLRLLLCERKQEDRAREPQAARSREPVPRRRAREDE